MMGRLNFKAHFFQVQTDIPPAGLPKIGGPQIKIARRIMGYCGRVAELIRIEQKKLTLRPNVKRISQPGGVGTGFPENITRISGEWGSVRQINIADQAGNPAVLRIPRKNGERAEIRVQVHIGFLNADKALDGRTVEHTLIIQRFFQLRRGDGDILQGTENIGKLQADKTDILLADNPDNIFLCIWIQANPP